MSDLDDLLTELGITEFDGVWCAGDETLDVDPKHEIKAFMYELIDSVDLWKDSAETELRKKVAEL